MTNFEWVKNDDKMLKIALTRNWGVNKKTEEPGKCENILCKRCLFFNNDKACYTLREEWLNEEHKNPPLYEEGDIVISEKGNLYVVFHECEGNLENDLLVASDYTAFDSGVGYYISKDKIKRKVGNVNKEEAKEK